MNLAVATCLESIYITVIYNKTSCMCVCVCVCCVVRLLEFSFFFFDWIVRRKNYYIYIKETTVNVGVQFLRKNVKIIKTWRDISRDKCFFIC